jgi:hypothetical protein
VAHSSFINDALANDTRVNKVVLRDSPIEASGLVEVMMFIYQSLVDKIPVIRNEELILYMPKRICYLIHLKPEGLLM